MWQIYVRKYHVPTGASNICDIRDANGNDTQEKVVWMKCTNTYMQSYGKCINESLTLNNEVVQDLRGKTLWYRGTCWTVWASDEILPLEIFPKLPQFSFNMFFNTFRYFLQFQKLKKIIIWKIPVCINELGLEKEAENTGFYVTWVLCLFDKWTQSLGWKASTSEHMLILVCDLI